MLSRRRRRRTQSKDLPRYYGRAHAELTDPPLIPAGSFMRPFQCPGWRIRFAARRKNTMAKTVNTFGAQATLHSKAGDLEIYRLDALTKAGIGHVDKLPFS